MTKYVDEYNSLADDMRFRKELFSDIARGLFNRYKKTGDKGIFISCMLQLIHDFPEIHTLYDKHFIGLDDKDISDPFVILRFLNKLSIVYENLEHGALEMTH